MKKTKNAGMGMEMKKFILLFVSLMVVLIISLIFSFEENKADDKEDEKITVVATLFPQYDFARQIAGEHINLVLLLPPGMESHSFDLRPSDMIKIKESDMFIYTGKYMESWAETIIASVDDSVKVVDASRGIELVKGNDYGIGEHSHEHEDEHDEDEHDESEHDEDDHEEEELLHHGHHHEYDPHIWTSPVNAIIMVENIRDALCEIDEANADEYRRNAESYIEELKKLDSAFKAASEELEDKCIFFGGRFAMTYFAREYGFDCIAAYHDCSAEAEPSIAKVMLLIDEIKLHGAKAIYYEELVDPKVAATIADETGVKLLLLHSAHNVSKADFDSGVTYLDIMWKDLDAIKEGLR